MSSSEFSRREKSEDVKRPPRGRSHPSHTPILLIHGGAGTLSRSIPPKRLALYRKTLASSLKAGHGVLQSGGEAMDAVVAAVSILEDCPLFNSGKGAVFNQAGKNELETSLMLSKPPSSVSSPYDNQPPIPSSRRGIGLTLLTTTRNPSHLARHLYLSPSLAPHTFLSGSKAESYNAEEKVPESYFFTEARWREHRRGLGLPESPLPYPPQEGECPLDEDGSDVITLHSTRETQKEGKGQEEWDPLSAAPQGTVGAIALDSRGCLASLTSTGGKTNKLPGRIGDTPILGAGAWASSWKVKVPWWNPRRWKRGTKHVERGVAVSGSGDGDYFIRSAAAAGVEGRMRHGGEGVDAASKAVVEELFAEGGLGGMICLDQQGRWAMPLNCAGMYRGYVGKDGVVRTAVFDDDELEVTD